MTTHGPLKKTLLAFGVAEADADALISEHDTAALREHAEKVHEVGTAKGWSVWAAAYLHPDTEFVDAAMPSTETIVSELRRIDRLAVLREAVSIAESLRQFDPAFGARKAAQISENVGVLRVAEELRRRADDLAQGKDTSVGGQPPAGESTPDFFQPGRTYAYAAWRFRCDAVNTHPGTGVRTALGWFRTSRGTWEPFSSGEPEWQDGVWEATGAPAGEAGS
ncbi:hypothetical protein ACF06P_35580 [Streptomyces sp. NPDC015684]|uniref:hypothetical protein n=1 Tax=Streptomyces sp. NPDC015684 TaxID=3364963 RepID=UPI0036F88A48